MQLTIATIAASLAATASAEFTCKGNYFSFFNRPGAVSYQRLDPALFPGTDSPHLHSFDGGNGLSASSDFAALQSSSCSTARVKDDKSLYWRPTLFFNKDGEFTRVPEKSTKIYYKYGDGANWANVTEFPEDFSMIAGDPFRRSDTSNPAGVRWGCHTPDGRSDPIFSNGFPKGFGSCDYGFASEVTFPSCWNGQKLDPKNPGAHMAWPNGFAGVGIENCPTTHRAARFPTIFIEFWYDISSFNGKYTSGDVPWALANGDPTGFGFQADFLNGWKKGVLGKATSKDNGCTCGCGCGQTEMEQCFGSSNVYKDSDSDFKSCSVGGNSGDAASTLKSLPGCNPLQYGPAEATVASGAGCSASAYPSSGGDKTSAAASTPAVTSAGKVSSAAASSAKANASSIKKDDTPALSLSIPNKQIDDNYGPTSVMASTSATPAASQQYGNGPSGGYEATKPTPSSPQGDLPSLSLASTPVPAGSTGKPSGSTPSGAPAGGKDEECKAPVYVTVTPTIFVTAGVNSTSCGLGTVTKTTTQTATVTIEAHGGFEYGSF